MSHCTDFRITDLRRIVKREAGLRFCLEIGEDSFRFDFLRFSSVTRGAFKGQKRIKMEVFC